MLQKWVDLMEFGSVLLKEFAWRYAPWAIALAPATFFGFSMFSIAQLVMPVEFAVVVGASTAVGLELVGVSAAGAAVELYDLWRSDRSDATRFYLATGMVGVYVVVGILTVLGSEFQGTFKLVGVAMFALAPVSYVTMALMRFVSAERQAEDTEAVVELEAEQRTAEWERSQQEADRAHQQRLDLLQAEAEKEARLATIQQEARVKIERARAKAAPKVTAVLRQNGRQIPSDWRQLSDSNKQELTGLPPEQLMEMANISRRTAERWCAKLSATSGNK